MSERSRDLPRRSVLVVPGSSDRFLAKAPGVPCDMVLLDLEDAVAPSEKATARARVATAVRGFDWGARIVGVRVNAWDGDATFRDVVDVVGAAGERLDVLMLPKVTRPDEVVALELLLDQVEREAGLPPRHVGIEVLVETAKALARANEVCAASTRLEAVALGPADLASALGIPTLTVGGLPSGAGSDPYGHALGTILVAARANGLQAIDGPYAGLGDEAALRSAAERSMTLGFDGKWAIHPDQVHVVNDVFSPSAAELERATRILEALEKAAAVDGRGAARFDGEMVDEASRQLAQRTLSRARDAGSPAAGFDGR
ncbi:MAG: Citrate (pro-3S)-lyase [Acidimicrobiaceae bacterium]|nr:Citrate (pro-3S)-lyase [Acidimicrobiaceae bacterium]